jgi:hypothetical protein
MIDLMLDDTSSERLESHRILATFWIYEAHLDPLPPLDISSFSRY